MRVLPRDLRLFQTAKCLRGMRIVFCTGVLGSMSLSICLAQQPAQSVATQSAGEQAPAAPVQPVQPVQAEGVHVVQVDPPKPMSPRQKQLSEDTAKLQVLAGELKAEMDKSSKDMLSLSVIKKAEEVEKLARKVEDEMKASLVN